MPALYIKNFGPIRSFNFNIKKLNVLIGKQASGKSTTAKVLFFFKMIPTWLGTFTPDNWTGNVFELFQKDLRAKFLNLFGPVYHQSNLKIVYLFNDNNKSSCVEIFQSQSKQGNNYITIKFDSNTRRQIEHFLYEMQNIPNSHAETNSITNTILSDAIAENNYKIMLEKAKKIFEETQTPIFIPAGRTQLTLFSGQLISTSVSESDIITNNFLRTIQNIRKKIGNGLEEIELLARRTWAKQPDAERAKLARDLITKTLRGSYRIIHGDERIYHDTMDTADTSAHTKLAVASSGQQESLWILITAYMLILERENVFITFEEPEAHLYPESQDTIMRLLVLLLGSAPNNQIIVTTHSPYLLTSLNNLLAADYYGKKNSAKNSAKIEAIVDRLLWLSGNALSVYQLDGCGEDIFDRSLNMICSEKIDSASQIMNNEYEDMFIKGEE